MNVIEKLEKIGCKVIFSSHAFREKGERNKNIIDMNEVTSITIPAKEYANGEGMIWVSLGGDDNSYRVKKEIAEEIFELFKNWEKANA